VAVSDQYRGKELTLKTPGMWNILQMMMNGV